jgi:DNA-binding NarL/FixJ family response regulator
MLLGCSRPQGQIGAGVKTAEIAERLHLSVKTVETYRDRIRQKLDLSDGTQLARPARPGR